MQDTITIVFLSITIISVIAIMYRRLMYITFDEKQAGVSGINVKFSNYVFIVLAAITVVTSIRLVGCTLDICIDCPTKYNCNIIWKRF